jgi:hypothetical protein
MEKEIFCSALRSSGDLGGVFEYDGETGYFYLLDSRRPDGKKIRGAVWLFNKMEDGLSEEDFTVCWDCSEQRVGLFIRRTLWAVFNVVTNQRFGGKFSPGSRPDIPDQELFPYRCEADWSASRNGLGGS